MDKRYRLYVEMQQRGKGTGVYRLAAGGNILTHHEAVTVRSKYPWASHTHLVEVDSPFERSLVLYEGWHDDLDARIAELRNKRSKCQG